MVQTLAKSNSELFISSKPDKQWKLRSTKTHILGKYK